MAEATGGRFRGRRSAAAGRRQRRGILARRGALAVAGRARAPARLTLHRLAGLQTARAGCGRTCGAAWWLLRRCDSVDGQLASDQARRRRERRGRKRDLRARPVERAVPQLQRRFRRRSMHLPPAPRQHCTPQGCRASFTLWLAWKTLGVTGKCACTGAGVEQGSGSAQHSGGRQRHPCRMAGGLSHYAAGRGDKAGDYICSAMSQLMLIFKGLPMAHGPGAAQAATSQRAWPQRRQQAARREPCGWGTSRAGAAPSTGDSVASQGAVHRRVGVGLRVGGGGGGHGRLSNRRRRAAGPHGRGAQQSANPSKPTKPSHTGAHHFAPGAELVGVAGAHAAVAPRVAALGLRGGEGGREGRAGGVEAASTGAAC